LRLCLCAPGPLKCSGISQLFVEYDYAGDGRQRFGLSLGLFVDCLNIFSSPGHASAVEIRYPGPDMQLLLKYVCMLSALVLMFCSCTLTASRLDCCVRRPDLGPLGRGEVVTWNITHLFFFNNWADNSWFSMSVTEFKTVFVCSDQGCV
jgi:hypothetical protein